MNYYSYFPRFLAVWLKCGVEDFHVTPWSICELAEIGAQLLKGINELLLLLSTFLGSLVEMWRRRFSRNTMDHL
jgi:hypothetical protein